jgi:nicotinamidase-related amidase
VSAPAIRPDDALVIVDVQHDFMPGGVLGVAEGERIIAPIEALAGRFPRVYATRDWHPPGHSSFAEQGGPWPVHCVAGSHGAQLDARIARLPIDRIVDKGVDRQTDGYSAFSGTDLADDLRRHGVRRVFFCGLATDYCVRASALDAKREGFEAIVIPDASAAVKLEPGDERRALEDLKAAGVGLVASGEISR